MTTSTDIKKQLCTALLAHVDAGKTTLSECMLYETGQIRTMGRVDHKDTFLDTDTMEKERGITIFSKQAILPWKDTQITLLDTPGHVDFSAEAERVLQVLDAAVLVISGSDGVQGHTETLWKLLKQHQVPTFLFINKMDLAGADRGQLMENLRRRLNEACLEFTSAPDAEFFESAAMNDEAAMEEYLETDALSQDTLGRLIRERKLFPCYFGSALKQEGVRPLMDGIAAYGVQKSWPDTFGARVFKISRDEQGNRLTHIKITGGELRVKSMLDNRDTLSKSGGKVTEEEIWEEKVDQIRLYSGSKYTLAESAKAGTVCAVKGLTKTWPGQGLAVKRDCSSRYCNRY
ncbi:MAG: GTP-binding protein [Lachnospiraceae bacterium]